MNLFDNMKELEALVIRPVAEMTTAWAAGKEIEYRPTGILNAPEHLNNWSPISIDALIYLLQKRRPFEWREKPKPRDFWLIAPKERLHAPWNVHCNEPDPEDHGSDEIVHVREVIT